MLLSIIVKSECASSMCTVSLNELLIIFPFSEHFPSIAIGGGGSPFLSVLVPFWFLHS